MIKVNVPEPVFAPAISHLMLSIEPLVNELLDPEREAPGPKLLAITPFVNVSMVNEAEVGFNCEITLEDAAVYEPVTTLVTNKDSPP